MVNFKSTFMNTKEYSDMHKKCAVNRERKLPLKDVARMLGYLKTVIHLKEATITSLFMRQVRRKARI